MTHDDYRRALEEIKLRAPIEDVVRERVPGLKRKGALWEACCPFHEERTPSFKVDPRRGTWRCFGACGTGGDQINFLERADNLGFLEVVEILAARTGVELPRRAKDDRTAAGEDPLYAPIEHAVRFYRAAMRSVEGQAAVRYLGERGLSDATAEAFSIGYAPAGGQALLGELRSAGVEFALAERAGLVRQTDQGRPYDFFRGRLVIPIRDPKGRAVGFGARRLSDGDEQGPKYINTAETDLFKKNRLFYALDRALPEIRRSGRIVLVEGYTDVMAAHQSGVANVVAVLGTATTDEHAQLLRRTGARRATLVFDGDEAGRKAAYKALHGLLPLEIEIDVVSLPGGDDPCDLLVREGATAFLAQLDLGQRWFDFLLTPARSARGLELSREVDRILELLARVAKPVHREALVAELARELDLPLASVRSQFASLHSVRGVPVRRAHEPTSAAGHAGGPPLGGTTSKPGCAPAVNDSLVRLAHEDMLGAVLLDESLWPSARGFLCTSSDEQIAVIADVIRELRADDNAVIDEASVLTALFDHPARLRVEPIVTRARKADNAQVLFSGAELRLQAEEKRRRGRAAISDYAAQDSLILQQYQSSAQEPALHPAPLDSPHAQEIPCASAEPTHYQSPRPQSLIRDQHG